MSFLLIALIFATLPVTIVASQCANKPFIGNDADIIATGFDDVSCGPQYFNYDCSGYIEAKSNSNGGYTQVTLTGLYNLLGIVSCNPSTNYDRCAIITSGSVNVGCCGSYQAYNYFVGNDYSTLTIGSDANVNLAKLELERLTSFTVGDNTTITDLYKTSSIAVRGNSFATFNCSTNTRIILVNTTIELRDVSVLRFEGNGQSTVFRNSTWNAEASYIYITPNNGASFREVTFNIIESLVTIDDVSISYWRNVNLNLNGAFILWYNDSLATLSSASVTMAPKSKWISVSSDVTLRNTTVQFGNNSILLLRRCNLVASNPGISYNITIGQNSSLIISSNTTERLRCNLQADLIIPPNVQYTEADVSDMLSCNSTGIEDVREELDEPEDITMTNSVETMDQRIEILATHLEYCPRGMTTATKRPTTATSKLPTKPQTSAGIKDSGSVYIGTLLGLAIAVLLP